MCLLAVHLLQCQSNLCLHLENGLLLWCFYRESLWPRRFLLVGRRRVESTPSFRCEWSQRTFEDRKSRIAWQTINEVSRGKITAKAKLKATSQQHQIHMWKHHFENLLGNPPEVIHKPITTIKIKQLDIKLGPFTQVELDSVL